MHRLEIGDGHSGIDLRGLDRGMARHFMKMPDRRASSQNVRRATVAKRVGRGGATDVCRAHRLAHDLPNGNRRHTLPEAIQEQIPVAAGPGPFRAHSSDIRLQQLAHAAANRHRAILAVLALADDQKAMRGIHIFQQKVRSFLPADRTRVQHFQNHPIPVAGGGAQIRLGEDGSDFCFVQNRLR